MARTGTPWRDLPAGLGNSHTTRDIRAQGWNWAPAKASATGVRGGRVCSVHRLPMAQEAVGRYPTDRGEKGANATRRWMAVACRCRSS